MTSPSAAGPPSLSATSTVTPQLNGQRQLLGAAPKEQPLMTSSPVKPVGTVAPADHVLTLVSSSVVNQRGFANTCGVPVGAHMDLQPSAALRLPRVAGRHPLRCNGCSAFLNVYCKTNLSKGVWKCNMCGAVNIHKDQLADVTEVTALAELSSEAVEYVAPLPAAHPLLPPPGPAHLVFVVDTTLEPGDLQAVREAIPAALSSPSVDPATLVSLITVDGCVAVHNLGAQRCSHVLPAGAGAAAGPDLQAAVQQLLDRQCAATAARRAGAGGGDGGGVLVSEVRSCVGGAALLPRVLSSLRTVQSDVPPRARARCLCSAIEAALRLIAVHASLDLTRHHHLYGSRVIVLAGGPTTRGPGAVPLELLDQAVPEKGRAPENRIVSAALDVGAALGDMAAKIGVPVDILSSTSYGINSKLLTAIAHGSGGELMPQATVASHFNPHFRPHPHDQQPADQPHSRAPAVAPGGGFNGWLLTQQLSAALIRRFGVEGRVDCYCSEGLRLVQWLGPLDPIQADAETAGPRELGGATAAAAAAAAPAPAPAAATTAAASGGPYRLSGLACCVTAVEAGRCTSLRLELTRDLDDVPSLLLQVALHFVDVPARCRVVRVVTRRMAVVESRGEFLRTVNPTAAAALLGKRALFEAKKAGAFRDSRKAEEARYSAAAQLGLVATRCGQEVQTGRGVLGFGGRKSWQWPTELMPLAYALYHFQRGPLLGPPLPPPPGTFPAAAHAHLHSLWDSDARLAGFNALLRAAWGDAYRAMAPKLYAVLPPGGGDAPAPELHLVALPCVSLAAVMARTAPLLLDVGTAILVSPTEEPGHGHGGDDADGNGDCGGVSGNRSGRSGGLTPSLYSAALQSIAASSCSAGVVSTVSRFPVPSVVSAPGAQAGDGTLAMRLIPVHRDSYTEQCLQHPQLQQLGSAVAAQLSKQLLESGAAVGALATAAAAAAGLPPAQLKQAAAAAASFVEWCRGVNVQPFPPAALQA